MDSRHRHLIEVIRGNRVDYYSAVGEDIEMREFSIEHPKGLRKVLEPRKRKPKPNPNDVNVESTHDVLTEHGTAFREWKRPKTEEQKAEARVRARKRGGAEVLHRRCPNCETLTNAATHCSGVRTVRTVRVEAVTKKPVSVLGPYRPYRPYKFRRVCACGDFTNDQVHCEGKLTFAR